MSRPELSPAESAGAAVQFLDTMHAERVFATEDLRREFLEGLTYDESMKLLSGMNWALGDHSQYGLRHSTEYETFGVHFGRVLYLPPFPEELPPIYERTLGVIKRLGSLKSAATLGGLILNAGHGYEDGNGRVARGFYSLTSRGYDGSQQDREWYGRLFTNIDGQELANPNPERAWLDSDFSSWQLKKLAVDGPVLQVAPHEMMASFQSLHNEKDTLLADQDKSLLETVIGEALFNTPVVADFFQQTGRDPCQYIRADTRNILDKHKLVRDLTPEDVQHIRQISSAHKVRYLHRIISCFEGDESIFGSSDVIVQKLEPDSPTSPPR